MTDERKKKVKMATGSAIGAVVGAKIGAGLGIAGAFGAIAGTLPVALVLGAAGAVTAAALHNRKKKGSSHGGGSGKRQRTAETLRQDTPAVATNDPGSKVAWSGYRPPKQRRRRSRMGDSDYLQLGENHEP